jgi:membrane-associated protease RseP (regulator of RpoE activity)
MNFLPLTREIEPPRILNERETPGVVQEVMDVRSAIESDGVKVFRGKLREPAETAFAKLRGAFSDGLVPLLQKDRKMGSAIYVLPLEVEHATLEKQPNVWINWLLFGLTFLTTTWAGALQQGVNLIHNPSQFTAGLPYSVALMAILGFHELGHYFTARHHRMNVTPPYFIPVPFALGTFGAFIRMRSPAENRRSLFDVAVAGPLAGLVLAIPALIIGLQSSTIIPATPENTQSFVGSSMISSSILFGLIAKAALGSKIAGNYLLRLSPLAFAGWLGLLVTALNLLPIGQLDGGHMAGAMFGDRGGRVVSMVSMVVLLLLALFVWPQLLVWAVIVFFIAQGGSPPLNDVTPLSPARGWLGVFTFLILALILLPMPKD